MDQLPRLGKRELICLLLFTCNYVVSVWRGFLFLRVLGMGYVILLWHSLNLPYNYSGQSCLPSPHSNAVLLLWVSLFRSRGYLHFLCLQIILTHISLASFLWDMGKPNSPSCDAAKRGVPSGAILFAYKNVIEK